MADQLSGIAIIICIAFGVLTFILLFIFAKRQIVRFTLKSRGGHAPVGGDASKKLMLEIERRLNVAGSIQCEPCVMTPENDLIFSDCHQYENIVPTHLYRMKVLEEVKSLDQFIASSLRIRKRVPGENVSTYYMNLHKKGIFPDDAVLKEFLDFYEHARHLPEEFASLEYRKFSELLLKLRSSVANADVLSEDEMRERDCQKHDMPKESSEKTSLLKKSFSFGAGPSRSKQSGSSIETQV